MNKRQVIGWFAACALLLSGCGAKPAGASGDAGTAGAAGTAAGTQTQAAASAQGTQDAPASQGKGQPGKRPAMNPQQLQMMETFQALLTMDKQDGLAITKDEAAKLLPVVQDVVKAGQISDDQNGKLRDPLTDEQKKYVDGFADNMKQRAANRGSGSFGGKQAAGKGGQKQAASGSGENAGSGAGGDNSAASNSDSAAGGNVSGGGGQDRTKNGGGSPGMGNRNVGQQLVDLLQSKTK